jgi:hypothetical protein
MEQRTTLLEQVLRLIPEATDQELESVVSFLDPYSNNGIERICRRKEAAEILGVSTKRVDQLASEGHLERIKWSEESKRASGFTLESVKRLAHCRKGENEAPQ